MNKTLLCTLLLAAGFAVSARAEEGRLLRFPTTTGTDVVFSYA